MNATDSTVDDDMDRSDVPEGDTSEVVVTAADVSWQRMYDRAEVERALGAAAEERAELRASLDAARERRRRAEEAVATRASALRSELASLAVEAHTEIARLEAEHRSAVDAIRAAANAEAQQILARVSDQADAEMSVPVSSPSSGAER